AGERGRDVQRFEPVWPRTLPQPRARSGAAADVAQEPTGARHARRLGKPRPRKARPPEQTGTVARLEGGEGWRECVLDFDVRSACGDEPGYALFKGERRRHRDVAIFDTPPCAFRAASVLGTREHRLQAPLERLACLLVEDDTERTPHRHER